MDLRVIVRIAVSTITMKYIQPICCDKNKIAVSIVPCEQTLKVHSHLRFSQLSREPELIVDLWLVLY